MPSLVQVLWPTREILYSFLIILGYKIVVSAGIAIYQKSKSKEVYQHHKYWIKAHQMLEDEVSDERKIKILTYYLRLQEEKILLNGHSLVEVQNNPQLGAGRRDFIPMIVNFISFRLVTQYFQNRSPVVMRLPFTVQPPLTLLVHFGNNDELKADELSFKAANFMLGQIVGRLVNKIVFGPRASIGMARKIEINQLRLRPALQMEKIRLAGYESLKEYFPDIDQAWELDDKTD